MLNASTHISVQAIIMSVHTLVHVYTYSVKRCNLDAIIYNKITSIVNIILKLFTQISKVDNVYYIIIVYMYLIGNGMFIWRVYVRYRDLMVSLAPSHGLVIAWKLMVHKSGDFCNSI